jgi:hypothetical protein
MTCARVHLSTYGNIVSVRQCVVCVVIAPFLQRGTYLVVVRFCGQILLADFVHKTLKNYFIEPSEKLTGARVLGTN